MNRNETIQYILKEKLVIIIRLKNQADVAPIIENLVLSGVNVLEVTANTPGFEDEITRARNKYPDILIGAGTVINESIAVKAIAAGAQFLVTPNTNIDVLTLAHKNNIPVVMGAFTPTEISIASNAGADAIKLFPANALGVSYFNSIKGPFDKLCFFAVGGVNLNNIRSWIEAGATGFGIGSPVKPINSKEDAEKMREEIRAYLEMLDSRK